MAGCKPRIIPVLYIRDDELILWSSPPPSNRNLLGSHHHCQQELIRGVISSCCQQMAQALVTSSTQTLTLAEINWPGIPQGGIISPMFIYGPTIKWTLLNENHINGLVQDCSDSSVLAMESLQSCTKPSISSTPMHLMWISFNVLNIWII